MHVAGAALDRAIFLLRPLAAAAACAGGALLLAAAVIVSFDVLARKVLSRSLGGADELSGYAFAIGTAWSFAHVMLERGNVRVDALYGALPSRGQRMLDLVALVALGTFVAVLVRYGYAVLEQSLVLSARSNSALAVPLAIPQGLWWGGYVLFMLALTMLTLRVALALFEGDAATVATLAGARSAVEEANDEIASATGHRDSAGGVGATPARTGAQDIGR